MRYVVAFCAIIMLCVSSQAAPRFIPLGRASGALYTPALLRSDIAFLAVHRTGNSMDHIATEELSKRGFMVLGMNTRFVNNEAAVVWEDIALDVRDGVRFLREQLGIRKVVLIGASGGGPTVSYYQAVAENGPGYCQGPNKIVECGTMRLSGFLSADKADAIILMDSHLGTPVTALRSINPLVDALDPFDASNGYNANGDSTYSSDFRDRYFKAQSKRMNDLIASAVYQKNNRAGPPDNDSFVIYHANAALADLSTRVHSRTASQRKLVKNDGSIRRQVIDTVRVPDPSLKKKDDTFERGAMDLTLVAFLSAHAIRSTHSLNAIEWCSSNASTICAVRNIRVPVLIIAAQGHYFMRDGEQIFENSASADRDFFVIEGMEHGLEPCLLCAIQTGVLYSNATRNLFDLAASWARQRF